MKKLIFLVFLIIPFLGIKAQDYQKNLINSDDKIIIQDSSAIDTAYAPIYIFKNKIAWFGKAYDNKDGPVHIFINNNNPAVSRRMQLYSDISLDYRYFNGYDTNEQIIDSLVSWTSAPLANWYGINAEKLSTFAFAADTMILTTDTEVIAFGFKANANNSGNVFIEGVKKTISGIESNQIPFAAGEVYNDGLLIAVTDSVTMFSNYAADTCIVTIKWK